MCGVSRRKRRLILLLLLIASCSLVFLIRRSARSPWQWFHIQFLNERYLYGMSTPSDPAACDNKTLFIGVQTRPDSFDKRSAIRRSWAAELPDNVILRFFVGRTDFEKYMELKSEQRRFGDIVFFDMPDGYQKLHLKVHAMMQWQQTFCAQAAFWLKTDDDATVHVARLLHHIEARFKPAMSGTKAIFCAVSSGQEVLHDRTNKHVSREVFPDDVYPPFCAGFSYLVSRDAVAAILFGTRLVKAFGVEDVLYTGVIAGKMGITKSSYTEVFYYAESLQNVAKCDGAGVPTLSAVFIHNGDPARLQADTFSLMKNQTCA